MEDPGDNISSGTMPLIHGPFPRDTTYIDNGDHTEEMRLEEVSKATRVEERGDIPEDAIVPVVGVIMQDTAMNRMSAVAIEINSDEGILAVESANEETARYTKIRNIFMRCCNTDTSSLNGAEPSKESETPSVRTVRGEILTDLQTVDLSSSSYDTNDGPDINEIRSTELTTVTPFADEINAQEHAESGETTPEEVVKSLLNEILDRVAPLVTKRFDDSNGVGELKEKSGKTSKIRQMLSTVLRKKGAIKNDSASSLTTGLGEKQHKGFRLFKRSSRKNKGLKLINNKIHPENCESTSSKTQGSREAADKSHGNCPPVGPGQTKLSGQAHAEPQQKAKRKNVLRKMFIYCICLGSTVDEIETDDENNPRDDVPFSDETTVSGETLAFDETTISTETH